MLVSTGTPRVLVGGEGFWYPKRETPVCWCGGGLLVPPEGDPRVLVQAWGLGRVSGARGKVPSSPL